MHITLIGQHPLLIDKLAKKLITFNHEITILNQFQSKSLFFHPNIHEICAPIHQAGIFESVLEKASICYFLFSPQYNHVCEHEKVSLHQHDCQLFQKLLDALRRADRTIKLIYFSDANVYGDHSQAPYKENDKTKPITFEGATALQFETLAYLYHIHFGQPSTGLRLFEMYHESNISPIQSTLIYDFVSAIFAKKPLIIQGDGEDTRDFIHLDDVVTALIQSGLFHHDPFGIFNLGTGKPMSFNALAYLLLEMTQVSLPVIHIENQRYLSHHLIASPALSDKILSFQPHISLEIGIKKLLAQMSQREETHVQPL